MSYKGRQAFGLIIELRTTTGSDGTKASKSHGAGDATLVFTAKKTGTPGNGISVALVDPGSDGALSVGVVGNAITVTLGYSSSAIDSTANAVIAAIYESAEAAALIDVTNGAGDGTGVVTALAAASLEGGTNDSHVWSPIPGLQDVSVPGRNRQSLEYTGHSSPEGYEEHAKSKIRGARPLNLPIKYDPLNPVHIALKAEEDSDDESYMRFKYPYGDENFESAVLVLDFPTENPMKDLLMTTVSCLLTGAPIAI